MVKADPATERRHDPDGPARVIALEFATRGPRMNAPSEFLNYDLYKTFDRYIVYRRR